jgi:hypothetical protein
MILGLMVMMAVSSRGQLIQGSIEKKPGTPNQVDVYIKPNFSQNTTYLFQLQFPIAFPAGATPNPTGLTVTLDPTFVATFVGSTYSVSVYALANSLSGPADKYYVVSLVRSAGSAAANSAPQTWTSGNEYKVMTIGFTNPSATPPSAQVKLADWADGGSDGQGNFYTLSGTGLYYVDGGGGGGVSTNNFYVRPTTSTVGGTAANGFAQTVGFVSLPVVFSSYDVKCNDKGAMLRWTTASEQNSSKFEIQRSTNGTDWRTVGTVAAAGNSSDTRNYQYLDISGGGAAQYRIRQVDINGEFTYTAVRLTSCRSVLFDVVLYPVPANDKLNVVVKSEMDIQTELRVVDMGGKVVRTIFAQISKGSTNLTVPVQSLAAGQYMLVSTDPAVNISSKFVVAH